MTLTVICSFKIFFFYISTTPECTVHHRTAKFLIIFLCLVSICHFYFGSQSSKRMSKNWSISHSKSPKKAKRLYFFRKFPDNKMVLVLLCIVYRANRLQKMSLKVDFINWNLKHYWANSILNLHSTFIILQFLLLRRYLQCFKGGVVRTVHPH